MYIILGGTGHIGSTLANSLLKKKQPVTIITRSAEKKAIWEQKGAKAATVDVMDTNALKSVFDTGDRLFLLNPPGVPNEDMEEQENNTLNSILEALRESSISTVVAESTYGAQRGTGIGDLGVLYRMEQELALLPVSTTIIRGAYYMSNWDMLLDTARQNGKIYSLFPAEFKLPMVAPRDIGEFAADLLMKPVNSTGLHLIEGPETYSSNDVAAAFSAALKQPVHAVEIPPSQWRKYLLSLGFAEQTAASFINMTRLTLSDDQEKSATPQRGNTTLQEYIAQLARSSAHSRN